MVAAALFALAAAPSSFAARPQAGGDDGREPAAGSRTDVDRDDPSARRQATEALLEGGPAPRSWYVKQLELARRERDKVGDAAPGQWELGSNLARVAGDVWVNVGPSRSDFNMNGGPYQSQDSGRARRILVHPANPNIIFLATSGGGVWKSYDQGGHWQPLTDKLGNTSIGGLAMDPVNPDILWLGLGDPFDTPANGVFMTSDGGATWIGPATLTANYTVNGKALVVPSTSVQDVRVDPANSARVLVAAESGLFISDPNDPGPNGLPKFKQAALPGVSTPGGTAKLWSIAWMGGQTWLASGVETDLSGATTSAGGATALWRSTNGGATWADARPALVAAGAATTKIGRCTLAEAKSTQADAANSRAYLICAAFDGLSTYDLYRTDDGGATFRALGVSSKRRPTNPNDSQSDLNVMHDQAWYNQAIIVDPLNPDIVFVGGNLASLRTRDGGLTWSVVSDWLPHATGAAQPYVHADFHTFGTGVSSDGTVTYYLGTDGGIFRSTDIQTAAAGAATVTSQTNIGLVSHLLYSVACAYDSWPAALQGWMVGGLQDNGTRLRDPLSANGPDTFNQVVGGDGLAVAMSVEASASQPADILASVAGGIRYSGDGGATFSNFKGGISTGSMPFFVKFGHDAASPKGRTFLTVTDPGNSPDATVYRSVDGGEWNSINGSVTLLDGTVGTQFISHKGVVIYLRGLATHPKATGIYAVYASAAHVFVTKDGHTPSPSWKATHLVGTNTNLGRNLGSRSTSGLAFDPDDLTGNHFFVSVEALNLYDPDANAEVADPIPDNIGHLFETTDGGLNWTSPAGNPTDPATRLPNLPIRKIAIDPNDRNTLYVALDTGLYRSTNGGRDFTRMGQGLPLVRVTDLCVRSGKIVVATYGRGFWQINTGVGGTAAGARGRGDLDFNLRVDGFDLLDEATALGTTNANDTFRPAGDLTGSTNQIDDDDLKALLAKFGGTP